VKIHPLLPEYCFSDGTYCLNFRENPLTNNGLTTLSADRKSAAPAVIICRSGRKKGSDNVSPLWQPVSPFQTLHALYLSGLCQRVSLIWKILSIQHYLL